MSSPEFTKMISGSGKGVPLDEEEWRRRTQQVAAMAWYGATQKEIAQYFGVAPSAFIYWMHAWPPMREAFMANKEIADNRVEGTLFDMATSGENNTATIFWLKNRRPNEWRDKREIEVGGDVINKQEDPLRHLAMAVINIVTAGITSEDDTMIDITPQQEPEHANSSPARSHQHQAPASDRDPDEFTLDL